MASYKYKDYLSHSDSDAFDKLYHPGTDAPYSGIYRCQSCGYEAACNAGQPLPPQNVHPHNDPILWRLAVYAIHKT